MDLARIRNIGIIAHIDAGKTTLSERILYYTQKEHRIGNVDEGTAKMDYLEEEQSRGITITSAATTCAWRKHRINLIDTPGHVDFTAEVERALRVLDGAVGVFCGVAGVQAQSETVWKQADRYRVPRIAFVNKLDRTGANFEAAVQSIRDRLGANAVPVQIPWGLEREHQGVFDLIRMVALRFPEEDKGARVEETEIPEDELDHVQLARHELLEALATEDEELLELVVEEKPVPEEMIRNTLRAGVLARHLVPVFAGSALKNKGVQPVLDAVVDLLPSPADIGSVRAERVDGKGEESFAPEPKGDLLALAFKTVHDRHGDLTFVRNYSGTLRQGDQVFNPRVGKVERTGRLFVMHADERDQVEAAGPGEIVAIVGLHHTSTGDTLCKKARSVLLEGMVFPETVLTMSIEPRTAADRDALDQALRILARDDPTFQYEINGETGQAVVRGMGELHLEILGNRLTSEFKVPARLGKPRVAYRQTIAAPAEQTSVFERQIGTKAHFGAIQLRVSPQEELAPTVELSLDPAVVPKAFWVGIEQSATAALKSGLDLGYAIVRVKVEIIGGEVREGETSEMALAAATAKAFEEAMTAAGVVILEPIMDFEVETPQEFTKAVMADLNIRRGRVNNMDSLQDPVTISGAVPLAEIFGYSTALRSMSQGRATFSVAPASYAPVPDAIAKQLSF